MKNIVHPKLQQTTSSIKTRIFTHRHIIENMLKDKFLERYQQPKLTQEEIENHNRTIACKEIKLVIFKKCSTN